MPAFAPFFRDGREAEPRPLATSGTFPPWLAGTLFINGPGRFRGMAHLFDGLALLHAITLQPGAPPTYRARFLQSASFRAAEAAGGAPQNREFASAPGGACGRARTLAAGSAASDNANVAIVAFRGALYAMTEAPRAWRVDAATLAAVAPWADAPFAQRRGALEVAATTSAHVLRHGGLRGLLGGRPFCIFLTTRYSLAAPPALVAGAYELALLTDDGGAPAEARVAVPPARGEAPAYMHSFAATATRAVLTEAPMRFSAAAMAHTVALAPHGTPITDGWPWDARGRVVFRVAELRGGGGAPPAALALDGPPFFVLHHVAAWDAGGGSGALFLDVVAYDDAGVLRDLSLAALRAQRFSARGSRLRRFCLDPAAGTAREVALGRARELPSLELPAVAPRDGARRFVYAARATPAAFVDALVKVDMAAAAGGGGGGGGGGSGGGRALSAGGGGGRARASGGAAAGAAPPPIAAVWAQRGCSPGEPVFVPRPGAAAEDDGVVLALVQAPSRAAAAGGEDAGGDGDGEGSGGEATFLLVLDARSFREVARAVVGDALPYTFHGLWVPKEGGA
jgi:beta,beta-carotene 9',10'-dioxygenase